MDDEVDLVDIYTDHLSIYGFDCISAYNGEQALQLCISDKPDVIISDINMPIMDGLTMLKKMKEAGIKVPVILVTAFSNTQKIREAWKNGAFDFLEKPIDFEILNSLIKNAMEFGVNFSKKSANLHLEIDQDDVSELSKKAKAEGLSLAEYIKRKLHQ